MSETEKDQWYMLGRIADRQEIAKELRDRAAGLFRGHNDKEAIELRGYAVKIELDAKHLREDYDKKYPKI